MASVRPIRELRLSRIKAAIWQNESNGSGPLYNVTISRVYRLPPEQRDKNDNGWRQTASLGRDDLLIAAEVLRMSFSWICQQGQSKVDAVNNETADVYEDAPF